MTDTIFASDLDNTLVFSHNKVSEGVCVEIYNGNEQGFMTEHSYSKFPEMTRIVTFVPVTTRSIEQFRRIELQKGFVPEYALTSNGATLLVNGEPDESWELIVRDENLAELLEQVRSRYCGDPRFRICRIVDDAFVYVVCVDGVDSEETARELRKIEELTVEVTGRKIYFFPDGLNKGAAVRKLREMLGAKRLIAAGDSSMDAPMLSIADIALIPHDFDIAMLENSVDLKRCPENMSFTDFIIDTILD